MELYATNTEFIGWLIIFAVMLIGLFICWLRYGRDNASVSDEWIQRHIDDRGKYRP